MKQDYPERELIAGCKAAKAQYQKALYSKYNRKMFAVCLRYTDNREDAMDVLQEGFIKVFGKICDFKSKGSLEGWIRRIMVHQSIEHYRKRSRYFMVDIDEAYDVGMDTQVLQEMSRDELLQMITALPVGYRTVFNLYVVEGYSHQEIAKLLNISAGTSKSQLSRAKSMLRERLETLRLREAI